MGKVLLERLLYCCSEVKEIIILMRDKRGKTAKQRIEKFKELEVRLKISKVQQELILMSRHFL